MCWGWDYINHATKKRDWIKLPMFKTKELKIEASMKDHFICCHA